MDKKIKHLLQQHGDPQFWLTQIVRDIETHTAFHIDFLIDRQESI